jgi:TolB-like protein
MNDPGPQIFPDEQNTELLLNALEKVLESQVFAEVFRLKKFLSYSVRETLAGNGDRLKGFVIACEVFEKDDPSDAQTTTVVRVEAGRLRRRLKDYYETEGKHDPVRISIPKGGYSASFALSEAETSPGAGLVQSAGVNPLFRKPLLWISVLVVLLLLILSPWKQDSSPPEISDWPIGENPLIAVMPFENQSGSEEGDSWAVGLTEDVTIDLGAISSIDVISVSSVLPLKGKSLSPAQVGEELGVNYVLRGTVRELSPRMRVSAHLEHAESGRQLWAERFESASGDTFSMQEELARKVVSSLSGSLKNEDAQLIGHDFTQNREAWQLYKQALNLVNPPSDSARLKLAQDVFQQVIEMDPGFAGGYAGSAYTSAFIVFFRHSSEPDKDRREAMELAVQARERDPAFGLTYSALAFLNLSTGNFKEALEVSGRAVRIQPSDSYLNAYHGFMLATNGDLDGGIPYVERALRLDPLNSRSPYLNILGTISYLAGDYQKAKNSFLRNRERGGPGGAGSARFLAATYSSMGETALAESVLKETETLNPTVEEWESWLLGTFADSAIPQKVIDEVEKIRDSAGVSGIGDS